MQDILEDVDPSMSSVAEIMTNLTEFRAKYPGNYRSGYICMSIPDLLKPLLLLDVSGDSFNVFYPNTVEKIIPADLSINTDSDKSQTTSNFCINEKPWHEPIREFSVSAIDSFKDEEKADEGGDEDGDAILLPAVNLF